MRLKPIRMEHLIVPELRRPRHLSFDDILDKFFRLFTRDHHLATGVSGDIYLGPLEGETRVRHLRRLPVLGRARRLQLFHLGVIKLDCIGSDRLGLLFLSVVEPFGHRED